MCWMMDPTEEFGAPNAWILIQRMSFEHTTEKIYRRNRKLNGSTVMPNAWRTNSVIYQVSYIQYEYIYLENPTLTKFSCRTNSVNNPLFHIQHVYIYLQNPTLTKFSSHTNSVIYQVFFIQHEYIDLENPTLTKIHQMRTPIVCKNYSARIYQ